MARPACYAVFVAVSFAASTAGAAERVIVDVTAPSGTWVVASDERTRLCETPCTIQATPGDRLVLHVPRKGGGSGTDDFRVRGAPGGHARFDYVEASAVQSREITTGALLVGVGIPAMLGGFVYGVGTGIGNAMADCGSLREDEAAACRKKQGEPNVGFAVALVGVAGTLFGIVLLASAPMATTPEPKRAAWHLAPVIDPRTRSGGGAFVVSF